MHREPTREYNFAVDCAARSLPIRSRLTSPFLPCFLHPPHHSLSSPIRHATMTSSSTGTVDSGALRLRIRHLVSASLLLSPQFPSLSASAAAHSRLLAKDAELELGSLDEEAGGCRICGGPVVRRVVDGRVVQACEDGQGCGEVAVSVGAGSTPVGKEGKGKDRFERVRKRRRVVVNATPRGPAAGPTSLPSTSSWTSTANERPTGPAVESSSTSASRAPQSSTTTVHAPDSPAAPSHPKGSAGSASATAPAAQGRKKRRRAGLAEALARDRERKGQQPASATGSQSGSDGMGLRDFLRSL